MNRVNRIARSLVADASGRMGRSVQAMRVHTLGSSKDQYVYFVAFRDNLWVGPVKDFENESGNIIETILSAHPRREEIEKHRQYFSVDVCGFVRDYIPDALCGYYDRKTRQIGVDSGYSVTSSPLVKKVTEALRARSVEQTDVNDKTRVYKRNQIKGNWDWRRPFYHGTSSEYFEGIVRLGLKPMPHQTNYEEVIHEDAIFLTPIWDEAASHAIHTASGGYNMSTRKRKKNFIPMVVSVTIPDPALVIPDYDVDQSSSATWYSHTKDPQSFYSVGSEKASKHAGLLGYKGRIPAKFIRACYLYSSYEKEWKRLTPDKFSRAVSNVDNEGHEFWYSLLGYPEEER